MFENVPHSMMGNLFHLRAIFLKVAQINIRPENGFSFLAHSVNETITFYKK